MRNVALPGLLVLALSVGTANAQVRRQVETAQVDYEDVGIIENEFILSGFVGSNFGRSADDASVNFGATFDYLRNGVFGVEFMAGFAPDFDTDIPFEGFNTRLYTVMGNLIAAAPLGTEGSVRPFISGGVGALRLDLDLDDDFDFDEEGAEDTKFAGNIGVGLMAFSNRWGFRADVRYISAFEDPDPGDDPLGLGRMSFWRGNVGVSFRW